MKSSATQPDFRVGITPADQGGHLLLTVHGEFGVVQQRISLTQARTLSLELIKQAYQAELKLHLHKIRPVQAQQPIPAGAARQASMP